jgi:hypothetical protein
MPDPVKSPAAAPAPAEPPAAEYHRTYGLLFQSWLVLFLMVICFALVNYLLTFLPK